MVMPNNENQYFIQLKLEAKLSRGYLNATKRCSRRFRAQEKFATPLNRPLQKACWDLRFRNWR